MWLGIRVPPGASRRMVCCCSITADGLLVLLSMYLAVTGLGSPDFAKMATLVKSLP